MFCTLLIVYIRVIYGNYKNIKFYFLSYFLQSYNFLLENDPEEIF